MITKKVINEIYKTYRRRPTSSGKLNLSYLNDEVAEMHGIKIADDKLTIGSIDARSPFKSLPLKLIHGIENFEDEIAIILHSTIIFLNKRDNGTNIHVKMPKSTLWERLRIIFAR